MRMYFNLICEEISPFGGKIIYYDKNHGTMADVHKAVCENLVKYPNGKWELYPMFIEN